MANILEIQKFVQEYAETIADVLEIEVSIIDENLIRMGGTGLYKEQVGEIVPHGSFFQRILNTGKPGIIKDVKDEFACQECPKGKECRELASMGFPIFKEGHTVGVIGLVAFNEEQREKIINMSPRLLKFLEHMSSLLESKLMLIAANQILHSQMQEAVEAVNKNYSFGTIIGKDPQLLSLFAKARQVAQTTSTILIRGESGTGKELLARAVHNASQRSHQPFIVVNCASIPENLLESELFGYEGGAFTGARKGGKPGKFALAHQGTIFLDEVGDLPLPLQPKILRVLQEKTIDQIGSKRSMSIDVRVIAATNKNLEEMILQGTFREDLYYRLNVIPMALPPLRNRKGDIPLLLNHYVDKFKKIFNKEVELDEDLVAWLKEYSWPGNIRQLENVMEYMINIAQTKVITKDHLPEYLLNNGEEIAAITINLPEKIAQYEKSILARIIRPGLTTKEKGEIATKLGISLATLYRKIERYKLD